MTVIPIIVGAPGAIPVNLEKRLDELEDRGRCETIQVTTLLKLAWKLWKVLQIWGGSLSFLALADGKTSN